VVQTALALLLAAQVSGPPWCSPGALVATHDGARLYIGCDTGRRIEVFDANSRKLVRSIPMPAPVTGLALSQDDSTLYATCGNAVRVLKGDTLRASLRGGHTAMAPVLSPDGARLYVANRFRNDISIFDTQSQKELGRIETTREPVSAAISPDGSVLFVANALPAGRADVAYVAAEISVIQTLSRQAAKIALPNGSTALREIRISPDGGLACVTHQLARFYLPATQIDRGWMQTNAFTLVDVEGRKVMATLLLDDVDRGAANPWAAAWSADGRRLAITHAGTHELSVVDVPALRAKLANTSLDPADDLAFLVGVRRRIPLAGKGPRALALVGNRAWVASYFSDTLEAIDLDAAAPAAAVVARLSQAPMTTARKGEMLFNDGALSFQGWLSCASCHSPDARVDGLNWDLLNDGIGNPKNARSLLLAHRTPPAMSQGVRENAEAAVRSGIRYILFANRPEEDAAAIDEFLKSLTPLASPYLVNGKRGAAAERGRKLFFDAKVGCAACHPPGLFTNLKIYDVGTRASTDTVAQFDTPTLVEIWRTAPYLHDGSAATLRDVLTTANRGDTHGKTSHLRPGQIDDLVAYLLSL
jgi:YVTN family beta-propeller protein